MGDPYPITPVQVPPVKTKHRNIQSAIPHPDSVPILEFMRENEPLCMEGQPPVIWDKAQNFYVFDAYGNQWIDFTSGVLITNAGHGRQEMIDAIVKVATKPLLTSYCFATQERYKLIKALQQVAPIPGAYKVMLLSTGAETTELCIKLAREHARRLGRTPNVFITFNNAYHGRTLGSQLAGGIPGLKQWIGYSDSHFLQVPFPDGGIRSNPEDNDFSAFEKALADAGVKPEQVAGVMTETYQGGNSSFAPVEYMQKLAAWCKKHQVILAMDEVQAGFGRTGKFWGFNHYGITPDLIACGKGVSGSLPLSAVFGRKELMDQFPPGSMTSTHSGNAICAASALASLELIQKEKLVENSEKVGNIVQAELDKLQAKYKDVIIAKHGKGLVASLQCVKAGSKDPDGQLAWAVCGRAVQQGLMLFAPVGFGGASVKVSPPLTITAEAALEGLKVLDEAFAFVLKR